MKRIDVSRSRSTANRRGVTLVEMLVTLAVLLLIMTIIVQIFQAATGAMSSAQAFQELDNQLRQLDATMRADLRGVTARMTPPLDPKDNLGYFEYGENSFADLQGEDSDDYVRFTARAPEGKPFTGRFWPFAINANGVRVPHPQGPITITSDHAEIIYFLRNGNLYRRVLLVAPERQSSILQMYHNRDALGDTFQPPALGTLTVTWQGMNDLSAHPAPSGPNAIVSTTRQPIILNTLGDLTNRENRFAYQRFGNDFVAVNRQTGVVDFTITDGVADDLNNDGVPDFYPTLYYDPYWNGGAGGFPWVGAPGYGIPGWANANTMLATMAFPYVFPGAYTHPEQFPPSTLPPTSAKPHGWIHTPIPDYTQYPFDGTLANSLLYLQRLNHAPLDVGDNLFTPAAQPPVNTAGPLVQTWWGFPTWRETLSAGWSDPTAQVNIDRTQPQCLVPRDASAAIVGTDGNLLPPMTAALGNFPGRKVPQLFNDGYGTSSVLMTSGTDSLLWQFSWEDDLIMTGVRSFDIKAYDDLFGGYVDLGWGDDARLTAVAPGYLTGTPSTTPWGGRTVDTFSTFAHEGRMPPLVADQRFDAQFGPQFYPGLPYVYNGNIGNDSPTIVRLRRVWDTWSTDYTAAPAYAINNPTGTGGLSGPPFSPPIYPSYPPPYPAPLRGIQIQIRVVDPTNQRVKQMTIRHDFTDRL